MFLISGFQYGFNIPHDGPLPQSSNKNLQSATEHQAAVEECIETEISQSRISGPHTKPPFQPFVVSPIGVVPKKTPNKFRLIHHLSYPLGSSINSGIDKHYTHVKYHTVDMAIQIILRLGRGCFLAKTDIQSAFRLLPVHPDSYHLLGFYFKGHYFFDTAMPMGLSISCQVFETFSTALQWIAQTHFSIGDMLHILDDFLFISLTHDLSKQSLATFQSLCDHLGVPLAKEKTEGPSQCLTFAGIELDTNCLEARLPMEKIRKYHSLASAHSCKKKTTLRELQSVIGSLNHCCYIIQGGRAFLRCLIDLTRGISSPHHHIRYNADTRADLLTWASFLESYNGRAMLSFSLAMLLDDDWDSSDIIKIYSDASHIGFGAICGKSWIQGSWPPHWQKFHISLLELYPIVAAFHTWAHYLANRKVIIFTDNIGAMHILNSCSSKDPSVMKLIRPLVLLVMQRNIKLKSLHIPGQVNRQADAISRFQLQVYHQLFPSADPKPTPIPPPIQATNLLQE